MPKEWTRFDDQHLVETVFLRCIPLDGGDEARRLCSLLAKMMIKAAQCRGWCVDLLDEQGWSMSIQGCRARLALKESGLHKFVTRAAKGDKKHTSFCKIEAALEKKSASQPLVESDVEFKAQKCGGPGGQHVNKTESAVRALHRPSGLSVLCAAERSQAENKRIALQWLQAKLVQAHDEELAKRRQATWAGSARHGAGEAARSYWMDTDRAAGRAGRVKKASAVLAGECEIEWDECNA